MSAYDGHAVRWSCAKCGQEHTLRETDDPDQAVTAVGQQGMAVRSNTEEIFTITSRSTRRENDAQASPTVRSGGWHVTVMGQRQGPMNDYGLLELLVAGKINARTYIWRHPMSTWVRMKEMPELEGLLAQATSGAAARRDSSAWPTRQATLRTEAVQAPPSEPSPYDSRVVQKDGKEETTGKYGIRGTPRPASTTDETPSRHGQLADELYGGIERPGIDIRQADRVPDDEDEDQGGGYWHSPSPSPEKAVRDKAVAWDGETTQPGKRRSVLRRKTRDRTTTIVIAVTVGVVALAAIVAAMILLLNLNRDTVATPVAPKHAVASTAVVKASPSPRASAEQVPAPAPVAAPPATAAPVSPVPAVAPIQTPTPAPAPPLAPSVARVTPVSYGIFDETALQTFVREQVPRFSTCRAVMTKKVETDISVSLMFKVSTAGAVETLVITPLNVEDPALNVCMQTIIRGWSFPTATTPVGFKGTIAIP